MCNNAYAFFCIACNSFNLLHFTAKIYEILAKLQNIRLNSCDCVFGNERLIYIS